MNSDLDIVPRFSSKAGTYQQYRWAFDRQVIKSLLEITALPYGAVVADIGSGTGLSSRPFVQMGCQVLGVEPNAAMRQVAEIYFKGESNYQSIDGRAERSGLADDFVDLIVVGRAIHWFSQAESRREFARISKRDGWLAIMAVKTEDEKLLAALRSVYRADCGWDVQASKYNRKVEPLSYFFDDAAYRELGNHQVVRETWPQFLGRLLTLSTAPNMDHVQYRRFERKLRDIFDIFQRDGELHIPISTQIAFGHPFG